MFILIYSNTKELIILKGATFGLIRQTQTNPGSAFCVRSGSTSTPSRPMANTEQTQKEHRKQTLILLADIKLLQKMTAFLYMCIRNIQGLGLQVVRKKTGLLHSLVRKAHPKS